MLVEALGHIANEPVEVSAGGRNRRLPDLVMRLGELGLEGARAQLVLAVERPEQGFQTFEQSLAIALDGGLRKLAEIFDVPDQVGQTELNEPRALAGVFAVGGVVVTAENSLEVGAQDTLQDLAAAGGIDFENDKTGGPETPGPVTPALVFVPGLIGIEVSLLGQELD